MISLSEISKHYSYQNEPEPEPQPQHFVANLVTTKIRFRQSEIRLNTMNKVFFRDDKTNQQQLQVTTNKWLNMHRQKGVWASEC